MRCRSTWAVTSTPSRRGGKYDGVLGVLGALEVVRTLNDAGVKTRRPIVVTNWTNEEAVRARHAGLGRLCGDAHAGLCLCAPRCRGKAFGDELKRIGWVGDEPVGARKMHAMLELHIEQGPILEAIISRCVTKE